MREIRSTIPARSRTSEHEAVAYAHPGGLIRIRLKEAGFSIPSAAVALMVNRANLNNMILGKTKLTPDMAYRLNVLIDPDDENFDLAREFLGMQAASNWESTAALRRLARISVGVGRKYGEMHEAGTDGHLTLTAAGLKQKLADAQKSVRRSG